MRSHTLEINDKLHTAIDARLKTLMTLAAVIIILAAQKPVLPLLLWAGAVTALWAAKAEKGTFIRILPGLFMGTMVMLTQVIWYGHDPLTVINIYVAKLTIYREGIVHGFLLASKVWASASILVLFSHVTAAPEIFAAARWFKAPDALVGMAVVAYRYIFIFNEEMMRIRRAQKIRFGYNSWWNSVKSAGTLAGAILLRSMDKSIILTNSMISRGYNGDIRFIEPKPLRWQEAVTGGVSMVLVIGFLLV